MPCSVQERGLLLVTPQHRLSLQHKWHELNRDAAENGAVCKALSEVAALPFKDLIDEADEVLHHR